MALTRITHIGVAACLLVASCSREPTHPQERAPGGTDAISAPQATPSAPAVQIPSEKAIEGIRTRYADVRGRLSSFREITRDLSGLSTEGGMLHAYFDGQALKLVRATFYGETGQTNREFYYDEDGRAFFVLEIESRYDVPLGATAGTQERRYYFDAGRLIRLLAGNQQVSPGDAAYASREKSVLDLSRQLWEAARQP